MTAMIQNDAEKDWMMPLLDFRNALDFRTGNTVGNQDTESSDRPLRDFRRMTGAVQVMSDGRPIPGPYTQEARKNWLSRLLTAQTYIQSNGPDNVRTIELITTEELQEIRRIWVIDKHELEDSLPRIYEESTGRPYSGRPLDDNLVLGETEMNELGTVCDGDRLHYELIRELLSLTLQQRSSGRRAKLHEKLEKAFTRHFYEDREDALVRARGMVAARKRGADSDNTTDEDTASTDFMELQG